MKDMKKQLSQKEPKPQRPLTKDDFEAVLRAATKPVKKESGEKESEGT